MSGTLDRLIRVLSAFDAEHPALTVAALARRGLTPLARSPATSGGGTAARTR